MNCRAVIAITLVLVACSGRKPVARSGPESPLREDSRAIAGPAGVVTLRAPVPLKVELAACPLVPKTKGVPVCPFESLPAPNGVKRFERVRCGVSTVSRLIDDGERLGLSVQMSVIEGSTSFHVPLIRLMTGEVLAVPEELPAPFLFDGRVAGIWLGPAGRPRFWREGQCEAVEGGLLQFLVPIGDGEVMGLRVDDFHRREVVLRRRDGTWVSLGPIAHGVDVGASVAGGRVALTTSTHSGSGIELAAVFPDLTRTEMVRRYPKFPARHFYGDVVPSKRVWGASRFSLPIALDYDWETGVMTLDRPSDAGGFERALVATVKPENGCRSWSPREPSTADDRKLTTKRTISQPALVALGEGRNVIAWIEDRVECNFELAPEAPLPACDRCPRQPPRGDQWMPKITKREVELVLLGVDETSRELSRVPLPMKFDEHSMGGLDMVARQDSVFVHAHGHLVEFDRAALEARW